MKLILLLTLPLALSLILEDPTKVRNKQEIAHGTQGVIFECSIGEKHYAKKRSTINNGFREVTALLFITSTKTPRIIHLQFLSINIDGFSFGMNLMSNSLTEVSQLKSEKWAFQLFEGLTALHRIGFTHNDLTKDNILIDADGNLFIGDLGRSTVHSNSATCKYLIDVKRLNFKTFADVSRDNVSLRVHLNNLLGSEALKPHWRKVIDALRDSEKMMCLNRIWPFLEKFKY